MMDGVKVGLSSLSPYPAVPHSVSSSSDHLPPFSRYRNYDLTQIEKTALVD